MKHENAHLSDRELLLDIEGEIPPVEESPLRSHLEACWKCRARRQELERAIVDFVQLHQKDAETKLPPAAGPRALLRAHMARMSAQTPTRRQFAREWTLAAGGLALLAAGLAAGWFVFRLAVPGEWHSPGEMAVVSIPDSRLTPGAALLASRQSVCAQSNAKNKTVPVALQRRVFEEYGIKGAAPQAYEIDYLVTPALGGADDIRNLWPHSYSATMWNARVKDALEDRLREMVCGGSLDLTEAQREIAGNWIAAYKKYFHTEQPLEEHWERTP